MPWPTPADWLHLVREDSFELLLLNMTVPNNNGTWPEALGGRIYPPGPRARLSRLFREQLAADCPGCPPMPDHEDGAAAAAAAAIASEAYLFVPPWLITSWWRTGRKGMWDAKVSGCSGESATAL